MAHDQVQANGLLGETDLQTSAQNSSPSSSPAGQMLMNVSLGGKRKDENVQTQDIYFMWITEVSRPGPFECALKPEDNTCKNKITCLSTRVVQKGETQVHRDYLVNTSG